MKKYCPYCHARLYQDEDDYCFECGKKIKKVTYHKGFDHIMEPTKVKNVLTKDRSKDKKTPLKDDTDWVAGLFVLFILYLVRVIFKYI